MREDVVTRVAAGESVAAAPFRGRRADGRRVRTGGTASVFLVIAGFIAALGWMPRTSVAQEASSPEVTAHEAAVAAANVAELEAVAQRAWTDAIDTWKRLMPEHAATIGDAHLNFVDKVTPRHCYGLYAGAGPVYCSGNYTVFIGIVEMQRLTGKLQPLGEVGLSVLIGHEIGHHIQRIHGRFGLLSAYVRQLPRQRQEWIRRFELEADCLAGIWIRESETFGVMMQRRIEIVAALRMIGDDTLQASGVIDATPQLRLHGTAAERVAAFTRGLESGKPESCDGFRSASFE